jgi:hypothetical protein
VDGEAHGELTGRSTEAGLTLSQQTSEANHRGHGWQELQAAASAVDWTLFPLARDMVTETPPYISQDLKEMQEKGGGTVSFDSVKAR